MIVWQDFDGVLYSGLLGKYRYRIRPDQTKHIIERQENATWELVAKCSDLQQAFLEVRYQAGLVTR